MKIQVNLEDCCEILDSKRIPITAANRKPGPFPYYGANGVQDYVNEFIFDDELVLLTEDGGNFNSFRKPIAYRVSGKCWVNNHAHVLKPLPCIDVDYLCYSLMFYRVGNLVNGATREKLTQSAMRKMQIKFLPVSEQKAIVSRIKKLQCITELKQQQLRKLDELLKCRFVEMFGDMRRNNKGWQSKALGEVCDVRDGTHDSPKYHAQGYPLVTSKNVTQGSIDFSGCHLISEEDYIKISKRSKVDKGDIIMPMIGTIGCPVIVEADAEFAIKNVALIKFPPTSTLLNVFVKYLLLSSYFETEVMDKVRGGTQKFISLTDIRKLKVYIPPLELQYAFNTFIQQLDKSRSAIQRSMEETQKLFDSLMHQYFD